MAGASKSAPKRQRLAPDERQQLILEGAIEYFAEFGFEGGTRELAKHLQISQALLFRYFPTKASLVDRVYEVVFLNRWNPSWEHLLIDRTRPLAERLTQFYKDYNRSIDRYEVIRISLFSALRNESISQRYVARIRAQLIAPIAVEVRATPGLSATANPAARALDEPLVLSLHATIICGIMRNADEAFGRIDAHCEGGTWLYCAAPPHAALSLTRSTLRTNLCAHSSAPTPAAPRPWC